MMRIATNSCGTESLLRLPTTSAPFAELRAGRLWDNDGQIRVGGVGRVVQVAPVQTGRSVRWFRQTWAVMHRVIHGPLQHVTHLLHKLHSPGNHAHLIQEMAESV